MAIVFFGALIIGITLGLLGSGGSAITVPVLIYMVGHHAKQSIAESMAIVGLISIAAAIPYAKSNQIDWRSVVYFGIPGLGGTFLGAWLGGYAADALQLVVFGVILFAAAYFMLRKSIPNQQTETTPRSVTNFSPSTTPGNASVIWKVMLEGSLVGIVTGFVGVGGGFLIVPALVVFGRLPMRRAIGTSLVIIAFKAAIGFAQYQQRLMAQDMSVDGQTILTFVLIGVVGSVVGKAVNSRIDQPKLKTVFASFLVVLGAFIVLTEGRKLISAKTSQSVVETATSSTDPKLVLTQDASDSLLATQTPRR